MKYTYLKDFYENTYPKLFNYFALNCKSIDDCRALLFSTYKAYILLYRKRRIFNFPPIDKGKLMSIALEELYMHNNAIYNRKEFKLNDTDVYIQEGYLSKKHYSVDEANAVKIDVFNLLIDFLNKENTQNQYRMRKIIAFVISLIYICIFARTYDPEIHYHEYYHEHHDTVYYTYDMQLIENRLYFSDGYLKYVDISADNGKSNIVSEKRVQRFYIFDDSIIYLNYNGIYVSKLTGNENKTLIDYSQDQYLAPGAIFCPYNNEIYFSQIYYEQKDRVKYVYFHIYCYDIQNETMKSIYTSTVEYENNGGFNSFKLQIIGINKNILYYLEEKSIDKRLLATNTIVQDTVKTLSLETGIVSELFNIPRSYDYETQIKLDNEYIYASPIDMNEDFYLSCQILKYSLNGELINKSKEYKKIKYRTLRLANEGELYFNYLYDTKQFYKTSINSNVISKVYKLNEIYRESKICTFYIDGLFCFTGRYDNIYTLFVIRPDSKESQYDIIM